MKSVNVMCCVLTKSRNSSVSIPSSYQRSPVAATERPWLSLHKTAELIDRQEVVAICAKGGRKRRCDRRRTMQLN